MFFHPVISFKRYTNTVQKKYIAPILFLLIYLLYTYLIKSKISQIIIYIVLTVATVALCVKQFRIQSTFSAHNKVYFVRYYNLKMSKYLSHHIWTILIEHENSTEFRILYSLYKQEMFSFRTCYEILRIMKYCCDHFKVKNCA